MNSLVALYLVALVGLASASAISNAKECIYVNGQCVAECPAGTRSYTTGCNRVTPEPTCDNPHPVEETFETCDFSDCYCIEPTVRDTTTKQCVTLDKCPKKEA